MTVITALEVGMGAEAEGLPLIKANLDYIVF